MSLMTLRPQCFPLILAALAALWTLAATAAPSWGQSISNPIAPRSGDPWVIRWKGQYFYTRTTGNDIEVRRAPLLQDINDNPQTVWEPPRGRMYSKQLWAPELHRFNDKWYIYFAADDGDNANHRMYVLEGNSQDPQGTYTFKGQITSPDNHWAIDGTVMEHKGRHYFIWSGWEGDRNVRQVLYIAPMSNPWTISGQRSRISVPTHDWEQSPGGPRNGINEGPQVLKHGEDVFLIYSANGFWSPDYSLGLLKLTGLNPMSPAAWSKYSRPVFDRGNGVVSTGHNSFTTSPDGTENWIVYHARRNPDAPRDLRIQRFTFGPNGLPDFGDPVASGRPIPAPSGIPLVTFIPNGSFDRGAAGRVEDFQSVGEVGVVARNGRFGATTGGDGPTVGYLGVGVDSGLYQDIGPLHPGLYTFSAGLALSETELVRSADNPATFLLRLERIGLNPDGSVNEKDIDLLAELEVESTELNARTFTYFDVSAAVPEADPRQAMLRVGIYAPEELAANDTRWHVKLDALDLEHGAAIPEPSAAMSLLTGAGLLLYRPDRRH